MARWSVPVSARAQVLNSPPRRLSARIEQRTASRVAQFSSLPDEALVDVRVVSAILNRSVTSVWRDVTRGVLEPPVRVGAQSSRFRVGNIRAVARGGR